MSALPAPAADGPRNCLRRLFDPVDSASLLVFRVGFGLMMAGWALHYLWIGRVRDMYVVPRFHFTYPGLEFITPWSGVGMQIHFVLIAFLGLMAAAGLLYRAATTLLALAFTYVFLLDRANYQNHYYLLALISWSMRGCRSSGPGRWMSSMETPFPVGRFPPGVSGSPVSRWTAVFLRGDREDRRGLAGW